MSATIAPETLTVPEHDPLPQPRVVWNSLTMGWRALLKTRHEPELMTDAIAIPVLFTLLFTYLFGGALSGSTHQYLGSLLPGTLVMSILLISVSAGGVVLALALILVFGFSVSWIWTSLGLVLRSAQAVSIISFAVQVPLTFASNVFVSPATLPGWLRAFVDANPVTHLVTAERALMNGTATAGQVGWVLLASAALVAVFGSLTMLLYRRS